MNSEIDYFELVEQAPDGILVLDQQGKIVFANSRLCSLLGYTPEELQTCNQADIFLTTASETEPPEYARIAMQERTVKCKDGSLLAVETNSSPLANSRVMMVMRDSNASAQAKSAVQLKLALLRAVVDNTPESLMVYDSDLNCVEANRAALSRARSSKQQYLNMNIMEMVSTAEERQDFMQEWNAMMALGAFSGEHSYKDEDGQTNYIEFNAIANILPGYHLGAFHDITARRRAEEALRESEERYRILLETCPDPVCLIDSAGVIILANRAALRVCEAAELSDIVGHNSVEFVQPLYIERFVADVSAVLNAGSVARIEIPAQTAKGNFWLAEVSAAAFKNAAGEAVGAICVYRDISERKHIEDSLRQLAVIVESSNNAIISRTLDGTLLSWNPGAEKMFGYSAAEAIGQDITLIYPPELVHQKHDTILKLSNGAARTNYETERVTKDGRRILVSQAISAMTDHAGNIVAMAAIITDITAARQAEQALQAQAAAEAANQAKNRFLSRMSHELRTPLNAVLGFAQLLAMDLEEPSHQESLSHILTAGNHLLALVNEVLDFARIEEGRLVLNIEQLPIADILRNNLSLLRTMAQERNVELFMELAVCNEWVVYADRQRLDQILLNLLSNAVKYNRAGGKVTLSCSLNAAPDLQAPQTLHISVADTGIGIPAEKIDRLFTPFDRLDIEQIGIDGVGLGLVLTRLLVEEMGGSIGVNSVAGHGSEFWVDLPADVKASPTLQSR